MRSSRERERMLNAMQFVSSTFGGTQALAVDDSDGLHKVSVEEDGVKRG
jgi:hypothetical protein